MTKYLLDDRERNGYDDSDFYAIYFDTETGTIRSEEYGSTRYASPRRAPAEYLREIPEEIRAQARKILFDSAFSGIRERDREDVDTPEDATTGEALTLLEDGVFKDKKAKTEIEYRAGETGTVFFCKAFGTFYRNGYNHPGRSNRRVGIKFPDGRSIFVPLSKCKRARPYMTDEHIRERAESFAINESYVSLGYSQGYVIL